MNEYEVTFDIVEVRRATVNVTAPSEAAALNVVAQLDDGYLDEPGSFVEPVTGMGVGVMVDTMSSEVECNDDLICTYEEADDDD